MVALPLAVFVTIALLWSGGWYYASQTARATIDGWRAREAKLRPLLRVRVETIGGYPFRIEVGCGDPNAEWRSNQPPLAVKLKDLEIAAQIYDPTLLNIDFTGPLVAGSPAMPRRGPPRGTVDKRAYVACLPRQSAHRASSTKLAFARVTGGRTDVLAQADHIELHGRVVASSANDSPGSRSYCALAVATAPTLHPLAAEPVNGEANACCGVCRISHRNHWQRGCVTCRRRVPRRHQAVPPATGANNCRW